MDTILKAIPLDDCRIEILTSSGVAGIFDVKPYLKGTAFRELADEAYFRRVRPAHHGIMWPHEQDFSSDTIISDIEQSRRHVRREEDESKRPEDRRMGCRPPRAGGSGVRATTSASRS